MQSIKDIKSRIKSVSETAQITRAMELISAAKTQKAAARYNNSRAYFDQVRPLLFNIVRSVEFDEENYYMTVREGKKAYLVIGSDKGMSGDYNHAIISYVMENTNEGDELFCIGEAVYASLSSVRGDRVSLLPCSPDGELEDARLIAATLLSGYDDGQYTELSVIYTSMVNKAQQDCKSLLLLPIVPEGEKNKTELNFEFAPDYKSVFVSILYQYVVGTIFGCILSGKYTEHLERMRATNAATQNANELLEQLQLNFNKARQEKITTELTELSSGLIDN